MVDARTFQALSDPTRLKILSLLGGGSMNVSAMVEKLDCTQPAVSRHLKVLKEAGLIVDARRGKWIEYSSNPSTVAETAEYLKALYGGPAGAADRREQEGRVSEPAGRPREAVLQPSEPTLHPTGQTRRPGDSEGRQRKSAIRSRKSPEGARRSATRPRKSPEGARKPAESERESSEPRYVVEPKRDFIDDLML
jgi:DNA-binding transcriptional ArsR family regulator